MSVLFLFLTGRCRSQRIASFAINRTSKRWVKLGCCWWALSGPGSPASSTPSTPPFEETSRPRPSLVQQGRVWPRRYRQPFTVQGHQWQNNEGPFSGGENEKHLMDWVHDFDLPQLATWIKIASHAVLTQCNDIFYLFYSSAPILSRQGKAVELFPSFCATRWGWRKRVKLVWTLRT